MPKNSLLLDNSIPRNIKKMYRNIRILFLFVFIIFGFLLFLFLPPSNRLGLLIYIVIWILVISSYEYVSYKSLHWHFSKIRFTPEGVYLYRDSVKYLPKERFIPWEKIIGFNMGKNAAILTINYNPHYLYGEAREMTPYYFLLYGVKKNPKIKKFIDEKYPFIYEKYRFELQEENKSEKVKIEGGDV